jgi:predicted metal-dependent peptidase
MSTEVNTKKKVDQAHLEHAIMTLISDKDFDGYLITRFDTRIVETLPGQTQTACLMYVNGRFLIRAAEKFFNDLTPKERVAVLKHEVAHFVNKHFARRNGRDPKIFNISSDCAINQGIKDLPGDCITLPQGWEPNEASEYYYEKYLQTAKTSSKGKCNKCESQKGQNQKGRGQGQGQKGQSQSKEPCTCGGSGLPDLFDEVFDAPLNTGPEADSMAGEIIRETIRDRLNAGVPIEKMRGLHAGNLEGYIDDLTAPPITDWRHVLSRFAATLADAQTRMTLKRPDRRGLSPFGRKKEYLPALCICVDTSGSVSNDMLSKFFSQIAFLGRQLSEIEVIIADAEVHEHFTYHKGLETKLKKSAFGRGGTDFEPAVQYINKNLTHCDGVVYLTDGHCPVPQTKCKIPLIWVVTESEEFAGKPKVMAPIDAKKNKRGW